MKKVLSVLMALALLVSFPIASFAADNDKTASINVLVEQSAQKYGITSDEVINIEGNLNAAFLKLDAIQRKSGGIHVGDSHSIAVSENLNLIVSLQEETQPSVQRAIYQRTISATAELQNIFGLTIVTLVSHGVFLTDGSLTLPIDAYGTYDAVVWNITNSGSSMGSAAYSSWVRNSFDGEFDLGIDPIAITIQTFSRTNTITCDALGNASSYWN